MDPEHPLVLYDGVCGLCNRVVDFVLRRDRAERFRFAPLQSDLAREILRRHGRDPDALDSFALVTRDAEGRERFRERGRAALGLAGELGWPWRALTVFGVLPTCVIDAGYRFVARRRYRWFGRDEVCRLPRPEERHRFLDFPGAEPASPR